MQSSLDSLNSMIKENNIISDQIERIEVYLPPSLARFFSVYKLASIIDAQFSLPYAFAMIIENIVPSPLWYSDKNIKNPRILKIAKKVNLIPDLEVERLRVEKSILSPRVKIVMKSKKSYEKNDFYAKGHPMKPFNEKDFEQKFINMLPGVTLEKKMHIINSIKKIDEYQSIDKIIELLNFNF